MKKLFLIFLLFFAIVETGGCSSSKPPSLNVQDFIESGTQLLSQTSADLNGDGFQDYILVLEKQKTQDSGFEIEAGQRSLLILITDSTGALKNVKRNNKIIYCATCGGTIGDPFVEVVAKENTFTVYHYGGSGWRWAVNYKFNYSKRDKTWQLVRVESTSFHSGNPSEIDETISTPPAHYGKIDIQDFDPEHWKGVGNK